MRVPPLPRDGVRYLQNARGILRHIPLEGEVYVDRKPVREAMGTRPASHAWRACLDRALVEEPARRWPSAEAFAAALPKASYARVA